MMNNKLGLYIHIPFCQKKCSYCDFYSCPASDTRKAEYTSALTSQMKTFAPKMSGRCFDTVFIGGGTPTCLDSSMLATIIETARNCFCISGSAELTLETNPGLYDKTDFKLLASLGVNRLSVGLQSADAHELELLGRIHSVADYEHTLEAARGAGITNINTDIMFSLPDQRADTLMHTLDFVLAHTPTHISAYALKLESGTPLFEARAGLHLPDEDADADMYLAMVERLECAGFVHYEISNFALPGHECRHNLKYWHAEEYLGLGPAAHSYVDSVRYACARDLDGFIRAYTNTPETAEKILMTENNTIGTLEAACEKVMLGLRLGAGVSKSALQAAGSLDIDRKIQMLIANRLAYDTPDGIALTARGMYVSNAVISLMLE